MSFNTNDIEMQTLTQTYTKLYNRKQRRIKINRGKLVKLIFNQEKTYHPCKAKIIDDSFDGCGLLVKSDHKVYKGQRLLMLMEEMEPIKAEVIWTQKLNDTEFRVGIKYLGSKTLKIKLFFQKTNPDDR